MEDLAIMKELERGREYVNQLQQLIHKSSRGVEEEALTLSYAQDLASKVDNSLRNAIFLLSNQDLPHKSEKFHEHSESRSHIIQYPTRLSPQKRKSLQTSEDYSKFGPKEDGHAWRKYGEKFVLNAKYPRCYYRCTYKYDKGCEATKQVQIIQDDPPLYRTAYFGHHTCSKPHMFLDSHHLPSYATRLISFHDDHNTKITLDQNNKDHYSTFLTKVSSFPHPRTTHPCKNSNEENIINDYVPSSLSKDCFLCPGEGFSFESDDLTTSIDVICCSKNWRSTIREA